MQILKALATGCDVGFASDGCETLVWTGLHSGQTQHACAIWADLMAANYREIQNTVSKSQKTKPLLEREALNIEYLRTSSYLFISDFRLVLCFVTVFLVMFWNEYVTIAVNRNLSNCEIARKKVFRGFNGIRTRGLCVRAAVLYQPELWRPIHWRPANLLSSSTRERNETQNEMMWTAGIQMKWVCDHRSQSQWSPEKLFFGLFRSCLNCDSLRWSHTHFICIPAVHIISFCSYVFFTPGKRFGLVQIFKAL